MMMYTARSKSQYDMYLQRCLYKRLCTIIYRLEDKNNVVWFDKDMK